jgi:chromosomal replication initiation ATPase DnaA
MQALLEATWERVQPALRAVVGEAVHEAWLAGLRPLALERGVLHFEAPNRMVCERVDQLYRDLLEREVSKEFGTRISIALVPAPESLVPDALEVGPTRPVVDASNKTAWLVVQALLEGRSLPSKLFLFHGPAGCGKSFLLDWWRQAHRGRTRWFDGPQLVKAFQTALRERRVAALREELCEDVDLVVDEVHRLAGHLRIQQELAKVLEVRAELDAPTLLASRWHPRDIRDLDDGLCTWLLAGFVTRLEAPGVQGRLAFLRALEGTRSRNGRSDAILRLAREVQGSYPDLRRAWALDRHRSYPYIERKYFELIDPRRAFDRARDKVAAAFGIEGDELCGSTQRRSVSQARKVLCWLCVKSGLSRAEVGRYLGRTRAAISYGIKSLEDELLADEALRREVENLL